MQPTSETSSGDPVCREYARMARDYDRRWARYVDRSVRATLARLTIPASGRVVDIGCGTGVLLGRLAEIVPAERLVGIDLTPAMLAAARERLPAATTLQVARAEALPLDDGAFAAAISCNAFHYVREPERALREMYRVLRPGGRLAITDWCHDDLACRLLDRWLRLTGRSHHRIHRARELVAMLETTGFKQVTCDRYRLGWWGMMTLTASR